MAFSTEAFRYARKKFSMKRYSKAAGTADCALTILCDSAFSHSGLYDYIHSFAMIFVLARTYHQPLYLNMSVESYQTFFACSLVHAFKVYYNREHMGMCGVLRKKGKE